MTPNCERISRKAEAYQWDGNNTDLIMGFLARNGVIGELYRDNQYILIKQEGTIGTGIKHGIWILKGEDGKIRYYTDHNYKLMYQPINDEPERLRAFALEVLDKWDYSFSEKAYDQLEFIGNKYGITHDSLKAHE